MRTGEGEAGPALRVEEVSFTYPGSMRPALQSLDFRVDPGEIFGFLGPSGAGKSTTQKILIGLLGGYAGRITVLGRELGAWGKDYYQRIGVSFELPNHYLKLTARENLEYFRALYAGETEEPCVLLEQVGLGGDAGTAVGRFSKGMRVRLNLARALLPRPRLLFLDEPTSGLDPASGRRIRDLILERRNTGVTVFLTTHNMTLAEELCDRVAFLVDGTIRLTDAPRALKLAHGRRVVRVEFRGKAGVETREFSLEGIGSNEGFLALLRKESVQTLHTQETSLEDIFLEITGRTLQ